MPYYLSNLLVAAYTKLGQLTVSTATGGTTATLLDTKQTGAGDNAWKDGCLFLIRDAAGASAAPENEMSLCTAYTDSTGSFASVWSAAPASGDTYGVATSFYPFYTMMNLANDALRGMGDIPLVDTSLTSASNKTEYTLPIASKRTPPYLVQYQGRTGDSDDNEWLDIANYDYIPATAGSAATLVLPQLPTGRTIKIWYRGVHPTLTTYNSPVNETLDPELVALVLTEKALEWQNSRLQGGDDFLLQREDKASQQSALMEAKRVPWKPAKASKLFILGGGRVDKNNLNDPDPGVRT